MLPYTQQDSYDRNRVLRTFKAIILENEHLKATFIPELGGRLWSLWDKDSARELLFIRPRIENNTDHDVWTYWWSNIAVSYTDGA